MPDADERGSIQPVPILADRYRREPEMSHISISCPGCGASYPPDMGTLSCSRCGGPLEVDYKTPRTESGTRQADSGAGLGIPLPLHDPAQAISLGEGNTPCVRLSAVGRLLGLTGLYGKLEFLNPTGSFKDRGTAVMMSVAREHGVTEVVEDSSGNAGASVSAYAASAGIKAHIFAPADAPPAKLRQVRVYGAKAHLIEGPREATTAAAVAYYKERGLVYASHALSPYFLEGTKSFAYEVARRFPDGLPDHLLTPVGNGCLYIGAYKGFEEMRRAGAIRRMPRLHCVQARAVMPVVAAHMGEPWSREQAGKTVAGGISVTAPPRRDRMVGILRETGGVAVAVDDERILHWQRLLAEREGIYVEPTSAAVLAGLEVLVSRGVVAGTETVLVPFTGFGLKDAPSG